MSDDTSDVGSPDRKLISLTEDHEVRYWTSALDITEERLREAVGEVGNSAEAVRAHLNK